MYMKFVNIQYINRNAIVINYTWFVGPWSNWSECSVSCGNGQKYRNRTCFITDCEKDGIQTIEYIECYMNCCPGNKIEYHQTLLLYHYGYIYATYLKFFKSLASLFSTLVQWQNYFSNKNSAHAMFNGNCDFMPQQILVVKQGFCL